MTKHITLPLTEDTIQDLKAGDSVLLSGTVITGRDAAHKRLFELIEKGEEVIDRSGIRNECLRYNDEEPEASAARQEDADAWLEQLCGMSSEQLQVLKDAISAVENASRQVEECEGA